VLAAWPPMRRPPMSAFWLSLDPKGPRMAKSIDLSPGPSRLASLLLSYIQYAPSLRLAIRAPRPRSSTDLAIRGP